MAVGNFSELHLTLPLRYRYRAAAAGPWLLRGVVAGDIDGRWLYGDIPFDPNGGRAWSTYSGDTPGLLQSVLGRH